MCIGTGLSINGRTLGFDRPIGGYFLIPIINALSTPKFVHFFLHSNYRKIEIKLYEKNINNNFNSKRLEDLANS